MLFFFTSKLFVGGLDGLLFLNCYCCGILSHFKIFSLSKMSLQRNRQNLGQPESPKMEIPWYPQTVPGLYVPCPALVLQTCTSRVASAFYRFI